jgi:hypothetical protein
MTAAARLRAQIIEVRAPQYLEVPIAVNRE